LIQQGGSGEHVMSKLLATCAAVAVTAMVALPAPASAAEHAGITRTTPTDISAARRMHHRYYRHHYVRRYYGHRYGYAPYNAYAYDPYYRPYRPGFSVGVGPFGFGFGF
jgi:hypothetical protein